MAEPEEATPPFRRGDPRQERIYRRLPLIGPGPAAFYRDACRLMADSRGIESTAHLVAHLFREIEGAVRDVLLPYGYKAPKNSKKDQTHRVEIEAILETYGLQDSPLGPVWLRLADRSQEFTLCRFAHRNALDGPRPVDEALRDFFSELEALLDAILERFEARFLESLRLIHELLSKTAPIRADAEALRHRVPNNFVTLDYFFSRLESPAWLELLAAEGFFRHPPEAVRDEEKGTISFPLWPESRYLAKMARLRAVQRLVLDIALAIPATANPCVNEDLADLGLALPAPMAAQLAPRAIAWLESPYPRLLGQKLGNLLSHLATGGEAQAALQVARSLFAVGPDPGSNATTSAEALPLSPRPLSRFEAWTYQQLLRKHIPGLVDAAGIQALDVLRDTLASAIRLSQAHPDPERRDDTSYVWRPTIEDHQQNRDRGHDLKDSLVVAVRDAAERIVRRQPRLLPTVVDTLDRHRWLVFRRIALHLLRIFPDISSDLVAQRLTDRQLFEEPGLWHEYICLAQEQFQHVSPAHQETILSWIDAGPDTERFKSWRQRETGQLPTAEEVERYRKAWQLKRLAPLRDALPDTWRERHDALRAELGEPEHPEFLIWSTGFRRGPTSPKTADDFLQMSIEEIVAFLASWEPSGDFMGPSPEGVGRTLSAVVAGEPERFAAEAGRFRGLDPTYVRGLLFGLREAVQQRRPFRWGPVLELCKWVVDRGPAGPEEEERSGGDRDPGWGWSHKAIAGLLEVGFQDTPAVISFEHSEQAWQILKPFTSDPDPTPDYEARYGGSNMNPGELSINTTRGEAMHALMRHALWRRREIQRDPNARARLARGLDEMPEVREILEEHLDPRRDRSPAVRAIYGWWLPQLVLIDREWVVAHLAQIFPRDPVLTELRDAAWDSYILYSRPFSTVFDVLREEYRAAIERLETRGPSRGPADPRERLAHHLFLFSFWNTLDLDSPEIETFYARASAEVRAHAMWFVGASLRDWEEEPPPPGLLEGLQRLWIRRLAAAQDDVEAHRKEIEAFGWWFASGRFDDTWALAQLAEVLGLTGRIDRDHLVVERLVELSASNPSDAVHCARLLVEGADERWRIYSWRDSLRTMLTNALRAGDAPTRAAAADLINVLAARGFLEFRDLLGDAS